MDSIPRRTSAANSSARSSDSVAYSPAASRNSFSASGWKLALPAKRSGTGKDFLGRDLLGFALAQFFQPPLGLLRPELLPFPGRKFLFFFAEALDELGRQPGALLGIELHGRSGDLFDSHDGNDTAGESDGRRADARLPPRAPSPPPIRRSRRSGSRDPEGALSEGRC